MKYRPRWSLLAFGAVIVILLFTYPSWRKVFTGRANAGAYPAANDAQRDVLSKLSKQSGPIAATAYTAMLTEVPAPTAEQPTPVLPDAQTIRTASFADLDAVRLAKGDVALYRSADGSLLLRFDNFVVTNAPGLEVYLSGNEAPKTGIELDIVGASRFPVGPLKGTRGNQQFSIPKDLQLARYKSVVIYSEPLQLVYGYATFR
jgi:hypothetical protein